MWVEPEKSDSEKGGLEAWPAPQAGAHTVFFYGEGGSGYVTVAVSKQCFLDQGTQTIFLVKVYKVLLNNVFDAFNLLKENM
jgi:hypothetical protein